MVSLLSKRLSRVFPSTTVRRHQFFSTQPFLLSSCYICTSVQSLSHVQLFTTPWTAACQASLSFSISWSFLKLMSIELVVPSNHLILGHPLLILPSIFPRIRIFSSELVLHSRWQRIKTSASTSVLPINIQTSFPLGLNGLLAVQETLTSLSQHHSQKASILQHSAFFIV